MAQSQAVFAMVGGRPDQTQFRSVVYFGAADAAMSCSAVKISDYFYLTAAHCVNHFLIAPDHHLQPIEGLAKDITGTVTPVHFNRIFLHPSWRKLISKDASDQEINAKILKSGLTDLALVEIRESLAIPSAPLSFKPVSQNQIVFLTGFGDKNTERVGYGEGEGLSFGQTRIYSHDDGFLIFRSQSKNGQDPIILEPGDSGGPAFIQTASGEFQVIGVNDWVSKVWTFSSKPVFEDAVTPLDSSYGSRQVPQWICSVVHVPACGEVALSPDWMKAQSDLSREEFAHCHYEITREDGTQLQGEFDSQKGLEQWIDLENKIRISLNYTATNSGQTNLQALIMRPCQAEELKMAAKQGVGCGGLAYVNASVTYDSSHRPSQVVFSSKKPSLDSSLESGKPSLVCNDGDQ